MPSHYTLLPSQPQPQVSSFYAPTPPSYTLPAALFPPPLVHSGLPRWTVPHLTIPTQPQHFFKPPSTPTLPGTTFRTDWHRLHYYSSLRATAAPRAGWTTAYATTPPNPRRCAHTACHGGCRYRLRPTPDYTFEHTTHRSVGGTRAVPGHQDCYPDSILTTAICKPFCNVCVCRLTAHSPGRSYPPLLPTLAFLFPNNAGQTACRLPIYLPLFHPDTSGLAYTTKITQQTRDRHLQWRRPTTTPTPEGPQHHAVH